jgi:hypothetical protein
MIEMGHPVSSSAISHPNPVKVRDISTQKSINSENPKNTPLAMGSSEKQERDDNHFHHSDRSIVLSFHQMRQSIP